MPNYAERSLLIYKVMLNRRGIVSEPVYVDDVDGYTADDLFFGFCEKYRNELIELRSGSRFIRIKSCSRMDGGVLVKLMSGVSGEAFDVVDVESAETIQSFDEGKAPLVESRCFFTTDYGRGWAFLCVEHVAHGAGDTVLLEPFRKYLFEIVPKVTMKREPVIEAKVIDNFVSVESVEVKLYHGFSDIADAAIREGDYVSYKLGHGRANPFGLSIVDSLKRLGRKSPVLYGLGGTVFDDDRSIIYVYLKDKGGRTRRFVISEDLGMPFREVLNDAGSPPLDDQEFIGRCKEGCDSVGDATGRVL